MTDHFWYAAILAALSFLTFQHVITGRNIMATQADIDKLVDQVVKIRSEVVVLKAAFAAVQAQVEANELAEQVDLSALAAAIESVDALNPDTVADEPAPTPAVDEPVFVEPVTEPAADPES